MERGSSLRVRVIERWQADAFDVFVFHDTPSEGAMPTHINRHVEGNVWRIEEVGDPDPSTGMPKPSVSLPREVVAELVSQARKISPSIDRDDAVSDARYVRDRMIDLVEKTVDFATTEQDANT